MSRVKSTMLPAYAESLLHGLDDLEVQNLKAGRITRQLMYHAMKQLGTFDYPSEYARMSLADCLNEYLEAGRVLSEVHA